MSSSETEDDAFRCLGYDCMAPACGPERRCDCPDYEPRTSPAQPIQQGERDRWSGMVRRLQEAEVTSRWLAWHSDEKQQARTKKKAGEAATALDDGLTSIESQLAWALTEPDLREIIRGAVAPIQQGERIGNNEHGEGYGAIADNAPTAPEDASEGEYESAYSERLAPVYALVERAFYAGQAYPDDWEGTEGITKKIGKLLRTPSEPVDAEREKRHADALDGLRKTKDFALYEDEKVALEAAAAALRSQGGQEPQAWHAVHFSTDSRTALDWCAKRTQKAVQEVASERDALAAQISALRPVVEAARNALLSNWSAESLHELERVLQLSENPGELK